MSEYAEKCIQEMLPELKEMNKLGLFTSDELSKILKKRRAHEYKIRRKTKEIRTYYSYIEYEKLVLKLLKKRRLEKKCSGMAKDIEVPIYKRIHTLYQLACSRFPGCVELWVKYIEFCIERNEKIRIAGLYTSALKMHPRNENLWIMAAKYEMERNLSMEGARNILQQSLRTNPRLKNLYLEYFRMELLNAEKIKLKANLLSIEDPEVKSSEAIESGMVAYVVFENAVQEFPGDVEFCLSFIDITKEFDFCKWIEDKIYDLLASHSTFSNNVKACTSLTFRLMRDTMFSIKHKKQASPIGVVLMETYKSFMEAIKEMNTEIMWESYLESLVSALKSSIIPRDSIIQISDHAHLICLEAVDQDTITESMAVAWMELLMGQYEQEWAQKVVPMLAHKFPSNVELWKAVFKFMTSSEECNAGIVLDMLEDCNKYLIKSSELVEIWKAVVNWFMEKRPDKMEEIFEISIETNNNELTTIMKDMYLNWAMISKSIQFVRSLFKELSKNMPYSSSLAKSYLQVELSQDDVQASIVRRTFDWALNMFGNFDIDLWLEYIKFETKESSGNVGDVYTKAIRNLDPGLESIFIEKYTLFKCGHE